jgi:hypothetical protein
MFRRARVVRPSRRLLLPSALAALVLWIAVPASAAAVVPIDLRNADEGVHPASPPATEPAPEPTVAPTPSATPTPEPEPELTIGYDISYPQCDDPAYPEAFAFAIVGVNGGRVHSENPCLGAGGAGPSQLEWAGPDVELYANTGNPGPWLSRYWPHGQDDPRECNTLGNPGADSLDCAFVYGWNAAADSYAIALDAFASLGWTDEGAERLPAEASTWWLDVEDANSWRSARDLNVRALEGAVAYLESMGAEVGFYSTPRLWDRITGGTDAFADHPAWHAGAIDEADALRRCSEEPAFTGGELRMVQWVEGGIDANIRCP